LSEKSCDHRDNQSSFKPFIDFRIREFLTIKEADTSRRKQDEHSPKSVFYPDENITQSFLLKEIRNQYTENEEYPESEPASFSFVSIGFSLFEIEEKEDGDEEAPNGFSEERRDTGRPQF
jgi:hypothetical protein